MNKIILRDEVAALSSRSPPSADTMQGWVTRNSIPSPWVPAVLGIAMEESLINHPEELYPRPPEHPPGG